MVRYDAFWGARMTREQDYDVDIDNALNNIRNQVHELKKKISLANQQIELHPIGELAEVIREHRNNQQLSLGDLSDLSGVSYRTLIKLEKGHPGVKLDTVLDVSRALGLKLWIG